MAEFFIPLDTLSSSYSVERDLLYSKVQEIKKYLICQWNIWNRAWGSVNICHFKTFLKKNKSTIIFKDGKQLNFKKKKIVSIWQEFGFILLLLTSVYSSPPSRPPYALATAFDHLQTGAIAYTLRKLDLRQGGAGISLPYFPGRKRRGRWKNLSQNVRNWTLLGDLVTESGRWNEGFKRPKPNLFVGTRTQVRKDGLFSDLISLTGETLSSCTRISQHPWVRNGWSEEVMGSGMYGGGRWWGVHMKQPSQRAREKLETRGLGPYLVWDPVSAE